MKQWWDEANHGIIGLGPRPDSVFPHSPAGPDGEWWPTEGYDSALHHWRWDETDLFLRSGHSREEWRTLAAEMIRRWKAFQKHIESVKDAS